MTQSTYAEASAVMSIMEGKADSFSTRRNGPKMTHLGHFED